MSAFVELEEVTFAGETGRLIFDRAGFNLFPGEKVLVAGPVASGKSVLVKLIAGLLKPAGGVVRLFGKDISRLDSSALNKLRSRVGFVFQPAVLVSNLKVIENVALPLLYHSDFTYEASLERAKKLLDMAGFHGDLWGLPDPLPLHERKTIAVARALSLEPDLLVCESLGAGLTEAGKEHLASVIVRFQGADAERALLFTSATEADSALFSPGRVLGIEGAKIVGKG